MNAVYDVDKQLLNNSDLWAIFDKNDFALEPKLDADSVAKRTAFSTTTSISSKRHTSIIAKAAFWES
jgi:hypothetical protein